MMVLAYIVNHIAIHGGIERIMSDKINYLVKTGSYNIHLITISQSNNPIIYQINNNVTIHNLNVNDFRKYKYNLLFRIPLEIWYSNKLKKELQRVVNNINPDIILTTNNTDVVKISKIKTKAKIIIESHTALSYTGINDGVKRNSLFDAINRYFVRRKIRKIKKFADALVVLTEGDKNEWNIPEKTVVIPNMTKHTNKCIYDIDNKNIIAIGRLEYQKGFTDFIPIWNEVVKKHPDWKLDIYGAGSLENDIHNSIERYNLRENVRIIKPTHQILEKIAKSSFLVLPSKYEGFGLVLIEAMMTGIPCVAYDCCYGPSEIITDNIDGLLVKNQDQQEMIEKICWMIEHPDERKKMAANAYKNVQRFTPENIMPKWEDLFSSLSTK